MPIQVASFIIPKNGEKFFIIEDKFIKGGLQSVPTSIERDAVLPENRKAGMLVVVQSDMTLWQLNSDLTTWTNLQIGGIEGPSGPSGERGEAGPSAYDVWLTNGNVGTEIDFFNSFKGPIGPTGETGVQGDAGPSAYQTWLGLGNIGDENAFLASNNGKSAYDVWLDEGNTGTVADFFASVTGPSAYQLWLDEGNTGKSIADFFASVTGPSAYQAWLDEGNVGDVSAFLSSLRGDDAYKIWIANGNVGTELEFLASIKGTDGTSLVINAVGTLAGRDAFDSEAIGFSYLDEVNGNIYVLKTLQSPFWSEPIPYVLQGDQGIQGIQGVQGEVGKSAYDIWIAAGNVGTEIDFILSIKGLEGERGVEGPQGEVGPIGETGLIGPTGDSAYQAWLVAGNVGTEIDFILSLKGVTGDKGDQGIQGLQGDQGIQGIKGDTGVQGLQGDKGDIGFQGPQGLQGDQGIKGDKGDTGSTGLQGVQGEVGKSAYQLWLDAGNVGTEADFILALKGVKGDKGDTGDVGPAGATFNGSFNGNMDVNGNILYKNIFANLAAFPNATTYEGMFVVAEDSNKAYFSSDGTWVELAIQVERVIPYDLSFFVPGTMPTANELVGSFVCARTIAITAGAPGSFAKSAVAPAASISYALNVNGISKGTVNFAAGQQTGSFTLAANLTLVIGDVVQLVTPGTIDASIKDVVITIVGRAIAPQLLMSF